MDAARQLQFNVFKILLNVYFRGLYFKMDYFNVGATVVYSILFLSCKNSFEAFHIFLIFALEQNLFLLNYFEKMKFGLDIFIFVNKILNDLGIVKSFLIKFLLKTDFFLST